MHRAVRVGQPGGQPVDEAAAADDQHQPVGVPVLAAHRPLRVDELPERERGVDGGHGEPDGQRDEVQERHGRTIVERCRTQGWQHRRVDGTGQFEMAPLPGGHSGETFLAEAAGERTVVRLYVGRGARRGPDAVAVDAAVLRLVHGLLPVADVLEARRPDADAGAPGLLVTSFLPGTRLDLLLPDLDDDARATVGRRLGELVARLACMPLPQRGLFVDGDLRVEPFPGGDLVGFVQQARRETALATWPAAEADALVEVADAAQVRLDAVTRTCLVHGDLNPKNLLVDPATCEVTGLLDWEFAHAGLPGTDLGNLLRFERHEPFAVRGPGLLRRRGAGRGAGPAGPRPGRGPGRPGRAGGPPRREPGRRPCPRAAPRRRAGPGPARRTVAGMRRVGLRRVPPRILAGAQGVCRSLRQSRFSLAIASMGAPLAGNARRHPNQW